MVVCGGLWFVVCGCCGCFGRVVNVDKTWPMQVYQPAPRHLCLTQVPQKITKIDVKSARNADHLPDSAHDLWDWLATICSTAVRTSCVTSTYRHDLWCWYTTICFTAHKRNHLHFSQRSVVLAHHWMAPRRGSGDAKP